MAKFERKTLKKTITSAEEQEAALARLQSTHLDSEPTVINTPSVSVPKAVVKEPKVAIVKAPKITNTIIEQPKAVSYKEKYPKETQRVNLDLPQDLYDAVQEQIKKNGQTMKGFFMVAAWEYIERRKQ